MTKHKIPTEILTVQQIRDLERAERTRQANRERARKRREAEREHRRLMGERT